MPWAWELARHCLNLSTGEVNHWPFPSKSWQDNRFFITAMLVVWQAWRFAHKPAEKWGAADIDYYDWLTTDNQK